MQLAAAAAARGHTMDPAIYPAASAGRFNQFKPSSLARAGAEAAATKDQEFPATTINSHPKVCRLEILLPLLPYSAAAFKKTLHLRVGRKSPEKSLYLQQHTHVVSRKKMKKYISLLNPSVHPGRENPATLSSFEWSPLTHSSRK